MTHPGSTDFDPVDRLAIINLVNSYADGYDSDNMDTWFELFTDDIKCSIYIGDTAPNIVQGEKFRAELRNFRRLCGEAGRLPLHANTNLSVKQQTADRAVAQTYILYIPLEIAALTVPARSLKETRITGTARYLFNLLKGDDGIWRIEHYSITYNQNIVEESTADALAAS